MTQTLEQLSAAATRARVLESRVDNRWQVTLDFGSDKDAMCQFSEAYRTGQLVAVSDDAIERVASVLDPDAMDMTQPCAFRENRKSLALEQAHKAIAAMKETQP